MKTFQLSDVMDTMLPDHGKIETVFPMPRHVITGHMKAIIDRFVRNERASSFVLPTLMALVLVWNPIRIHTPYGKEDQAASRPISGQAASRELLRPEPPADFISAGTPLISRFRSLGHSWRGRYGRFDLRDFTDVLSEHAIEIHRDTEELQNVRLAAGAIDGIAIFPNEIFSFNEAVGRRTPEKGYQPGLMFSRGQLTVGIGGGICIVSTALYNAALQAGMKIIERRPHSGVVRYAEPGLDAAIAYGTKDLKIKNDLGRPVLIQASLQDGTLRIRLYGRKRPGLEIVLVSEGYREIPFEVVEKPVENLGPGETKVEVEGRTGYEVTTIRVFKQDGRIVRKEIVAHSLVPPQDMVVLVPRNHISNSSRDRIISTPFESYIMTPTLPPPPAPALEFRPPENPVSSSENPNSAE